MGPSGLGGLRSALTPVDSCARAHLTTVVLRRLVAAWPTALGVCVLSQTLSDHVFLICCGGIASIANDYQTAVRKKIVCVPVGFTHTHSSPFRNASAPVSVLCSKLEVNDVIKCVRADEAINFSLVRACVARSLRGAALG